MAAKKYKTGTLNFEYNFQKQGNFIGLVKAPQRRRHKGVCLALSLRGRRNRE